MLREEVRFTVTDSVTGALYEVAGWLSIPSGEASGVLHILVHGACYTHQYFDLPYKPDTYSYVEWAYQHERATLNIDRLGNGWSSHPPAGDLGMELNADALRQLIDQIRHSGVLGRRFSYYVVVGHSLGSLTAGLMQATYAAADALVLTGATGMNVTNINDSREFNEEFVGLLQPATESAVSLDIRGHAGDGYFVMPTAIRPGLFFRSSSIEPSIIGVDLDIQGTMTSGENATLGLAANLTELAPGPILVQIGRYDAFFFDPDATGDTRQSITAAKQRAPQNFAFADLVDETGHNLTQHPTARSGFAAIGRWVDGLVTEWRSGTATGWQPNFVAPAEALAEAARRSQSGSPIFLSDPAR